MASGERVLITGGSGFIGACLVRDLLADGCDVHLVLRSEAKLWRLADLAGQFTSHAANLCDRDSLARVVQVCRPDVIYNLATHGAYPFQKERSAILATNLLGTAHLLEALRGHAYRALVHTGSSSEYGHKEAPLRETDLPEPRTDYGVSKAAATMLCLAEAYQDKPVSVVRVFSAYGPWEEPTRLVPYLMDCCLRGENPRVTAGQQPRDFVHVDDVVRLLRLAADLPQARGHVLHAGTGCQHTVLDMIETVMEVAGGGRLQAEYGGEPTRADEPRCWVASIEETTRLTGWRPRHTLRSGVEQMWNWFTARASRQAA